MRVTAKDILAQLKKTVQVPQDQLEYQPILEDDDAYALPSTRTKLEHEYVTNRLDYGDRMRMVNPEGNLADVILMPDGGVGIQNLTLKIEYGATTVYSTWEEADQAAQGFDFYKAIVASRSTPKLFRNLLKNAFDAENLENPYVK